jgi:LasA protease
MGIWNAMAKRLKLGKDISLKIRFTDNNLKNLISIKVLIGGLVVALVTLSCAIGVLDQNDPPFNAPAGGVLWTPTPPLIFPTDRPIPTVTGDPPPVVESQAISTEIPTPQSIPVDTAPLLYYTQAGDTLPVIAIRFGVDASEIISSADTLPQTGLLIPNTLLIIPHRLVNTTSSVKIMPDSELVYSPSEIDFDVEAFVNQAGGYLSSYREWLGTTQWTSGAEIVQRVALENSINPKLLLALLEYQSGWVYGQPANPLQEDYPLGKVDLEDKGLYSQLAWAVNQLSIGYYGWREGLLTDILFLDGVSARMAPDLNAGTVALQYYFAQIYNTPGWVQALDQNAGLPVLYERMYGSPWLRAMEVEPLYPPNLTQPNLILPFLIGQVWSYTGGPHGAWERDGARAAIDFAPGSTEPGCVDSEAWVVAAAPGLIVRAAHGVIVEDLDGDGKEQTGWDVLYLHISDIHVTVGDWVETSDLLGHPSCEGGLATGTHVHIARKYNGEWIPADGPLPFMLSGWTAHAGSEPYQGTLTKGSDTVPSSLYGARESLIMRTREDP